jgi:tripartite-type tricarboxylate transporter receptor subunit TctC
MCIASSAVAQGTYPDRPIRWILPIAASGGSDTLARTIQGGFTESIGQQIVIDNRPGGSSVIGTEIAAKAAPDGYTLLFITTTHTVNPSLIPKLPYDSLKDFAAISLLVSQPNILVVPVALPVKSVKELIALAKAKPDTLSFASGGNGSQPHLTGELFKSTVGLQIAHVPVQERRPGGDRPAGWPCPNDVCRPARRRPVHQVRALARAGGRQHATARDTSRSTHDFGSRRAGPRKRHLVWHAGAGAHAAADHRTRVRRQPAETLQMPDVKARLLAQGVDIIGSSPQQFSAYLKSETAKWAKVIKDANVRPE